MTHVTYTDLRQNLSRYMDETIASRAPLLVTRQKGKGNVYMISEQELDGMRETMHLMSSPANAAYLLESIAQANRGEFVEYDPALLDNKPA